MVIEVERIREDVRIRNKRFCCDFCGCENYAYAEVFNVDNAKGGKWAYVCRKHYDECLDKAREDEGLVLCVLSKKERRAVKP